MDARMEGKQWGTTPETRGGIPSEIAVAREKRRMSSTRINGQVGHAGLLRERAIRNCQPITTQAKGPSAASHN